MIEQLWWAPGTTQKKEHTSGGYQGNHGLLVNVFKLCLGGHQHILVLVTVGELEGEWHVLDRTCLSLSSAFVGTMAKESVQMD